MQWLRYASLASPTKSLRHIYFSLGLDPYTSHVWENAWSSREIEIEMDPRQQVRGREADRRVTAFVAESNRIEGILRYPTDAEIKAHKDLIACKRLTVEHVTTFVAVCQPGAVLRATTAVHGVRVGNHIAPASGPKIVAELDLLLKSIANGAIAPWAAHLAYETLNPYTDGNGRSGRAIWLWHMTLIGELQEALALGFLHSFYHQTLAASH